MANLDHSRANVAVDARRKGWSWCSPPQILCNEADTVISARPKGKNADIRLKWIHIK